MDDYQTELVLDNLKESPDLNIIRIKRPCEETLGNARNNAIYRCEGKYVCIWDDDDWHHEERLNIQLNAIISSKSNYLGSILSRIILYDCTTDWLIFLLHIIGMERYYAEKRLYFKINMLIEIKLKTLKLFLF
jgi:glycosyltransferase involved in cell wall biosynthesis